MKKPCIFFPLEQELDNQGWNFPGNINSAKQMQNFWNSVFQWGQDTVGDMTEDELSPANLGQEMKLKPLTHRDKKHPPKLSVQPQEKYRSSGSCGRRSQWNAGTLGRLRKPDWKHVRAIRCSYLECICRSWPCSSEKNSLELDEVQRNAIKMIRREQRVMNMVRRAWAILGKIKRLRLFQSAKMEVETSCVYERRLHARSVH